MLATIIILAIIVAIAIVIFAVKAANVNHNINDIYVKQVLLQKQYGSLTDCIDGNFKSLAELNRRQDEWERSHRESDKVVHNDISRLGTEVDKLKVEFLVFAQNNAPQYIDTPATDQRKTRDTKQTAQANREHFAEYRTVMSVREAAKELGVSLTTAKRYEKWRKAQEQ